MCSPDPHSSNGAFERPEIVIPYVYGGELDDLIGNDVRKGNATTTPTPGDERRDSTHKQRNLHVFFYVSGAPLRLRITRLHDLTLRSSRIEWMGTNYTESKRIYRKCLFGGAVVGDPGSTATLDVCDGLVSTHYAWEGVGGGGANGCWWVGGRVGGWVHVGE